MRTKAIKDLAQLSNAELFEEIAQGLRHLLQNAELFYRDAELLAQAERGPSSRVLRGLAEEEAAKFLILIDAVRCPCESPTDFRRLLGYFYDHLARGIYAQLANGQPSTFGDLRTLVDNERKEFFLDGPNGDDYIYRNRILARRESRMYVDYEEYEGDHTWSAPPHHDPTLALGLRGIVPPALATARALQAEGFVSPDGLAVIAGLWRAKVPTDDFTRRELVQLNRKTCTAGNAGHLSEAHSDQTVHRIVNYWQYPLYPLDLSLTKVPVSELQDQQGTSWLRESNKDAF